MAIWYAITGEWILLLNPGLWLLFLHPAILFYVLRRKVKHPIPLIPLILWICVTSPLLSWMFSILNLCCEDLILEYLIDRGASEYVSYYHSDGPSNVITVLFGWIWSLIIIPFWLVVLFVGGLVYKGIRLLNGPSTKTTLKDS